MKKVLYLHGLESNQGGPKVDFLANEFIVHAPKMDYKDSELNIKMFFTMQDFQPDLIIGSSMGGYVAEYPIEGEQAELQERKVVVLGKEDEVIPPYLTKIMLESNFNYKIVLEEMGHQTPLNIFIDTINNYKNEL
jgi:hypothetical protein